MRRILILMLIVLSLFSLTSCFAGMFEEEIKVIFTCDGEEISSGVVTQFKNIQAPELPDAYLPDGYKFFGWTGLKNVKATDPNFKKEYIGGSKMVHYMDVRDFAKNGEVKLEAVIISLDEIPIEYHYVVIAWYDKFSTSGVNQELMNKFEAALMEYLKSQGVSDDDLATIVIRGYSGNVGPSCGAIMSDGDVDIMIGWNTVSNLVSTGGMSEDMIFESDSYTLSGTSRYIHRISEKETASSVYNWIKSDACRAILG